MIENATLSEKLIKNADVGVERLKARFGDAAKIPGHIRLMYSAAAELTRQEEEIAALVAQNQKLMRSLMTEASCKTCLNGAQKKCSVQAECGADHTLWRYRA